jgi:DNA (cytosine-5)-methyltransferase 1
MYGRLKWSEPAQTITSGFSSIGQGRYMHPDQPRALTAHEAARVQGFPDYFDFSVVDIRKYLVRMIGNAVPPELGRRIFTAMLQSLG